MVNFAKKVQVFRGAGVLAKARRVALRCGLQAPLPGEPRIYRPEEHALTARHLSPVLPALEAFFLAVRARVDLLFAATVPPKNGKPYPLGQCLEISLAVEERVAQVDAATLSGAALVGQQALAAFLHAGGSMRRIWGDLRGKYFQNAFLIGSLYVDVSNDTVVPTKPKVEILPLESSGLKPIADYHHFAHIARQYWDVETWPNHVLPELAPFFPVLVIYQNGRVELRDEGGYLMTLNFMRALHPGADYLAAPPIPQNVFDYVAAQLRHGLHRLARSPTEGRRLALQNTRVYRKKRWHQNTLMQSRLLVQGKQANQQLAQATQNKLLKAGKPMNILFIHQNFPGQFKFLAPALAQRGHNVVAMTMQKVQTPQWQGVQLVPYTANRGTTPNVHPWVSDTETKVIRGEACFRAALALKAQGFVPDVIVSHHGWGESLFLKDVWPAAKLAIYCEFFYHTSGADVGFDPEFPATDAGDACRLRLKNLNNLLHFEVADAGISPTHWQASTFPEPFRSKITVVHDGIDTKAIAPNPAVSLTLSVQGGEKLVLTRQDEVITFVNRNLEPYRGYHTFMRALPELLKRRPKARVLMVGGNDVSYGARPEAGKTWKEIFASEVRPHISDADWARVHFLGHIPYAHFIPLLQLSTVHVYLTYPFVLSWSLLEAMSAGCAIVASNTQPLHEAITHGETGRLVDFFDSRGLANEICALLDDPAERARLGTNARAFAAGHYDLQTVCLPKQLEWVEGLVQ